MLLVILVSVAGFGLRRVCGLRWGLVVLTLWSAPPGRAFYVRCLVFNASVMRSLEKLFPGILNGFTTIVIDRLAVGDAFSGR